MIERPEILSQLSEVFSEILGTRNFVLTENSTANDVNGWDSLAHIDIILATEEKFSVRITAAQASKLQTVGELVDLIQSQLK